mgnify:CR=1 FL=1
MKKGLTELVFILDKSGSMGGLDELCCKGVRTTRPTKSTVAGSFVADLAGLAEGGAGVYYDLGAAVSLLEHGDFTPPQIAHTPHTAAKLWLIA